MPWFVKLETGLVPKAKFDAHVPAHLAYVDQLNAQGHQAQTGYWRERGGGMLLFQAQDYAEALAIVEADPLVQAGLVSYALHEWVLVTTPDPPPTAPPPMWPQV
ncbi:MAG: hypothetical protein HC926_06010 [Synechococcaceae cyanobacterium SM2_3_60]|nr:hypothetical protein [Synechococcaceae cyanobacterium SM2_3_60]